VIREENSEACAYAGRVAARGGGGGATQKEQREAHKIGV